MITSVIEADFKTILHLVFQLARIRSSTRIRYTAAGSEIISSPTVSGAYFYYNKRVLPWRAWPTYVYPVGIPLIRPTSTWSDFLEQHGIQSSIINDKLYIFPTTFIDIHLHLLLKNADNIKFPPYLCAAYCNIV